MKVTMFALAVLCSVSCVGHGDKATPKNTVKLPIETSIGSVVRVEKRHELGLLGKSQWTFEGIIPLRSPIKPEPGIALYLLHFEGKSSFYFAMNDRFHPLLDSTGKQFPFLCIGNLTSEGVLGHDGYSLQVNGPDPLKGNLVLPESKVVLVYLVPDKPGILSFSDGNNSYSLPEPELNIQLAPPSSFTPEFTEEDSAEPARPAVQQTVSTEDLTKNAIKRVKPTYPANAKGARIFGKELVQVVVDESGNVVFAKSFVGHPLLRDASVKAARGWKFKPFLKNDQPIKVRGILVFNY